MRVLLTGGAGFIGSNLASCLVERGMELAILDDFNPFYDPAIKERNLADVARCGRFQLWRQDLLEADASRKRFREFRPETVIHLAARAGVRPSLHNPLLYQQVNLAGTVVLLELCREFGIGRFIFGSTSSVYGVNSRIPFREDDPLNRLVSPYAVSKRAAELMCYSYHHNYGFPICCLRFFTVYGPRQRPDMAIHKFTRMILAEQELPLFHQGRARRDFTYVDDVVSGILAAMTSDYGYEIVNLGNSRTVELLELVRLLELALGRPARVRLEDAPVGDVPITCADISKAKTLWGWEPRIPIEEGLARFVSWFHGIAAGTAGASAVPADR